MPTDLPLKEIADGVHRLTLPLPFRGLDHVHAMLIEDEGGWCVVDTGFAYGPAEALWRRVFDEVFQGKPITKLIVTHYHPDHCGLAGWMTKHYDVQAFYMSQLEWALGRILCLDKSIEYTRAATQFYQESGVPDEWLQRLNDKRFELNGSITPLPARYQRLKDGDSLTIGNDEWAIMTGEGHAPEQVMLYRGRDHLLLAADQIMARITPNISVWPFEPTANPIPAYFASLKRLEALPAETAIHPFHARPVDDLHARIQQLYQHHEERSQVIEDFCRDKSQTIFAVCQHLFPRVDNPHSMLFAMGEARAHVNYLIYENRLTVLRDKDGVLQLSLASL